MSDDSQLPPPTQCPLCKWHRSERVILEQRLRALEAYATVLEDGNKEMISKIALLERFLEEIMKAKEA